MTNQTKYVQLCPKCGDDCTRTAYKYRGRIVWECNNSKCNMMFVMLNGEYCQVALMHRRRGLCIIDDGKSARIYGVT